MEPRLKTSKKWTPYPTELTEQIREVVETFFADYDVQAGEFVIEGEIYPEEILLRIGMTQKGQLRQDNFEASLQYGPDDKALELIHVMADFLGETWINYLEDAPEPEDLPRQWQENYFEKNKIYLRYTTVNTTLEAEANRLLQEANKSLVYENDDVLDTLEVEGVDPETEFAGQDDEIPIHYTTPGHH